MSAESCVNRIPVLFSVFVVQSSVAQALRRGVDLMKKLLHCFFTSITFFTPY